MKALRILSILFFCLQIYFVIWGRDTFDKFENPIYLFLSFVGLAVCFLMSICRSDFPSFGLRMGNTAYRMGAVALSLLLCAICYPVLHTLFLRIPLADVVYKTDVLPLIVEQYDLFVSGDMPYKPITLVTHTAYPAYMPLHWLPVGIARGLGIDPRWAGLMVLLAVVLIFVWMTVRRGKSLVFNLLALVSPIAILYIMSRWADSDVAITFETVIAAYYMFLAIALMQKNIVMVVLGIVLCLMSRYTLIFWLPLFFILYLINAGWRKTAMATIVIVLSVCLIFVFPFLLKDPNIILDSLTYHNNAAIGDWSAHQYSFEWGVYFGPNIDSFVVGSFEHKVFVARAIQASTMLLLLFLGLLFYKKNKHRANFYDLSLGMLHSVVVGFYMCGPFAFRYYMMGPLYLSVVLLARVLLSDKRAVA